MKSFWDVVHATKPVPADEHDDGIDPDRIAKLIESRVGRIEAKDAVVRKLVREVLPAHLVAAWDGSRDEAPMNTIEYAALALGEDIRVALKGDRRPGAGKGRIVG